MQQELESVKERTIAEIYERENADGVTGKEAWNLYLKTIQNSKKKSTVLTKMVSKYSQAMKEITHKINDMQRDLFECFQKATVSEASTVKVSRMTEGERLDTTANSLNSLTGSSVSAVKDSGESDRREFGLS